MTQNENNEKQSVTEKYRSVLEVTGKTQTIKEKENGEHEKNYKVVLEGMNGLKVTMTSPEPINLITGEVQLVKIYQSQRTLDEWQNNEGEESLKVGDYPEGSGKTKYKQRGL